MEDNMKENTTEAWTPCNLMRLHRFQTVPDLPSLLPLHHHKQHLSQCCQLLNDEWQRSDTARMRSLESSSDDLPTSLVLVENKDHVIGHVKLTPIPSQPDSCFVESVVIEKSLRGRGYGTYLMQKCHEYCKKKLSLRTVYLSTKGQEGFYRKLGYDVCEPVSIYGSFKIGNFGMSAAVRNFSTKPASLANSGNSQKLGDSGKNGTMAGVGIRDSVAGKVYMKMDL